MEMNAPNERPVGEPMAAGPRPERPLRQEVGGALALLYAPSFLGVLLAGLAREPDAWPELLPLLPFAPVAFPALFATGVWPALGVTGRAEIVAGVLFATALTLAMVQFSRIVLRASQPSRVFLQASMTGALVLQAWLVVTILLELG